MNFVTCIIVIVIAGVCLQKQINFNFKKKSAKILLQREIKFENLTVKNY